MYPFLYPATGAPERGCPPRKHSEAQGGQSQAAWFGLVRSVVRG